jgi:hypothetical protein
MPYRVRFLSNDRSELGEKPWKTKEMAVAHAKGQFLLRKNQGTTSVVVINEATGMVILDYAGEAAEPKS